MMFRCPVSTETTPIAARGEEERRALRYAGNAHNLGQHSSDNHNHACAPAPLGVQGACIALATPTAGPMAGMRDRANWSRTPKLGVSR